MLNTYSYFTKPNYQTRRRTCIKVYKYRIITNGIAKVIERNKLIDYKQTYSNAKQKSIKISIEYLGCEVWYE